MLLESKLHNFIQGLTKKMKGTNEGVSDKSRVVGLYDNLTFLLVPKGNESREIIEDKCKSDF